jgi:phage shock protein A
LAQQQERLEATTQQLQARVEAFRTQKETLKASYTAAQAQTRIGEAVSGISESMSDTGLAMQRAQDKIAQMQARAGAVDELLASGTLTDLSGSSDPIQAELDKAAASGDVELQLAQMKAELNPPAAAPSGALGTGNGGPADASEEPVDGELVHDGPPAKGAPAAPADPFTLDDAGGAS